MLLKIFQISLTMFVASPFQNGYRVISFLTPFGQNLFKTFDLTNPVSKLFVGNLAKLFGVSL